MRGRQAPAAERAGRSRLRPGASFLLLLVAVPPAALGHSLVMRHRAAGWWLTLVAFLLAVAATRLAARRAPFALPPPDPRLRRRWVWLLVGAVLAGAAFLVQLSAPSRETLVLTFWLSALACTLVPWLAPSARSGLDRRPPADGPPIGEDATGDAADGARRPRRIWLEVVAVVVLLGAALAFRLPYLERFPVTVHNDEASCGLMARQVLEWRADGERHWFRSCDGFYNFPSLGFFPSALAQAATHSDLYGHRLANVVLGTAALLVLFLLARSLYGRTAGLVALGLGAAAHMAVHWSRSGIHSGHAAWLTVLCAWLAWRAVAGGRLQYFVLLGFALAACLLTYNAAFLVPLWAALVLGGPWVSRRTFRKRFTAPLAVTGLAAVVFFAPMLAEYVNHPGAFFNRRGMMVWARDPGAVDHMSSQFGDHFRSGMVRANLKRATRLLHDSGDSNLQYGNERFGIVDRITAVILVLGAGVAVARLTSFGSWPLLTLLALELLLGGVLPMDGVQYSRIAGLALVLPLLPALWARQLAASASGSLGRAGTWLVVGLLAVFVGLAGGENFRLYFRQHDRFNWTSAVPRVTSERSVLARRVRDWGPHNATYVGTGLPTDFDHQTYQLVAAHRVMRAFADVADLDPAPIDGIDSVTFVLPAAGAGELDALRRRFPGGRLLKERVPFLEAGSFYVAYRVPAPHPAERPSTSDDGQPPMG